MLTKTDGFDIEDKGSCMCDLGSFFHSYIFAQTNRRALKQAHTICIVQSLPNQNITRKNEPHWYHKCCGSGAAKYLRKDWRETVYLDVFLAISFCFWHAWQEDLQCNSRLASKPSCKAARAKPIIKDHCSATK